MICNGKNNMCNFKFNSINSIKVTSNCIVNKYRGISLEPFLELLPEISSTSRHIQIQSNELFKIHGKGIM